jgi:hypothetical protein
LNGNAPPGQLTLCRFVGHLRHNPTHGICPGAASFTKEMVMKKQKLVMLFVVGLVCLNLTVHAQDDADVRRELEAQYKKLAEAHDRKDLKAIAALKTTDFHAILPDGRVADVKRITKRDMGEDFRWMETQAG